MKAVIIFSIFFILFTAILFVPPPIPDAKDILHAAQVVKLGGAVGPKSLAFDSDGGGPYAGVADGRILKWQGDDLEWTDFAWTAPERHLHPDATACTAAPATPPATPSGIGLFCYNWIFGKFDFMQALWLDKNNGGYCLMISSKGLTITGMDDYRYWNHLPSTSAPEMEHVCGRPLGLRFHSKTGDLYIADAYLGLHKVGPKGGLATPVITEIENKPLRSTNDMDIDEEENAIYFTDTSAVYQKRQFITAILSLDKTGRLMKYDLTTKKVTVLMNGLAFANGVALSKGRSFVLVAETTSGTILRYWLKGQKAGSWDVFAELPGFPDNIRRNSKGEFWVALHSKKGIALNWALRSPWVGKFLLKTPLSFKQLHFLMVGVEDYATVIKLSKEGQIVEVLEDSKGKTVRFISEAQERNGKLWLGSVITPFVGYLKLS